MSFLILQDQEKVSRISRLIIAGNSIGKTKVLDNGSGKKSTDRKKYGYDSTTYNAEPTLALDSILSTLCATIPVSIMPGPDDPASVALPQQPIHQALFDKTKAFVPSTFECVTNPSWWDIDGVTIFGTSGQNIDDVYRYVENDHIDGGRVGLMERMLRWRHCAPTAPDTLCISPRKRHLFRVLPVSGSRSLCIRRNATYFLCRKSTSVLVSANAR